MDKQIATLRHTKSGRVITIYNVISDKFLSGLIAEWQTPDGRYEVELSKAEAS
jgi:hypothetical protein